MPCRSRRAVPWSRQIGADDSPRGGADQVLTSMSDRSGYFLLTRRNRMGARPVTARAVRRGTHICIPPMWMKCGPDRQSGWVITDIYCR